MSANKSIAYNVKPKYGVAGSAAGTINGPGIDTAGYEEGAVCLAVGNITGNLDVKVQDSADNSSFADVTGAAFAQIAASGDNQAVIGMLKFGGNTVRRYIRIVSTVQATFVADHGATVLLIDGRYNPQQTPSFTV